MFLILIFFILLFVLFTVLISIKLRDREKFNKFLRLNNSSWGHPEGRKEDKQNSLSSGWANVHSSNNFLAILSIQWLRANQIPKKKIYPATECLRFRSSGRYETNLFRFHALHTFSSCWPFSFCYSISHTSLGQVMQKSPSFLNSSHQHFPQTNHIRSNTYFQFSNLDAKCI